MSKRRFTAEELREHRRNRDAARYVANREKMLARAKEWRVANRDAVNSRRKARYAESPEPSKAKARMWYAENREAILARLASRGPARRTKRQTYENQRRANDPAFRITKTLRTRIWHALQGRAGPSAIRSLGCSAEKLCKHLEERFLPGMSWKNYGFTGWHIDHIIPISVFDLTDPGQAKAACHYTNLQPLWANDNLRKGNRP